MRTGLSSAVAPGASLPALIDGATRHGLTTLELRAGDRHGVSSLLASDPDAIAAIMATAREAHVAISGYRDLGHDDCDALAILARTLGTSILVAMDAPLDERLARADRLRLAGATVAVVVRGEHAAVEAQLVSRRGHAVAWDATPVEGGLGAQAAAVIEASGGLLGHVGVAGGGPESALHEGRGIGELMARLALSRYAGTVILAPSDPSYHLLWERWLARPHGWGCGSHASDATLVTLNQPATIGGAA